MTKIENARITAAKWSNEECLTHEIYLEGDGWCGCTFGGFVLERDHAALWIKNLMKVIGTDNIDSNEIKGKYVRIRFNGDSPYNSQIEAIGNILNDVWFTPKEVFKTE